MSNHLAVATVTAALKALATRALVEDGLAATVTHVRPDALPAAGTTAGVNVFLYRVSPNPALRNADLPTRDGAGAPTAKPFAALDMHYLFSFSGDDTALWPQRAMGSVVRLMHSEPVLGRTLIRDTVAGTASLTGGDLADAVELVRLSPEMLSLEDLSRLWSVFFQTPYRLSVAWLASAVLIEARESPRGGLPVRTPRLYVPPMPRPRITLVAADVAQPSRPAEAGETVVIEGADLGGTAARLRLDGVPVSPGPDLTDTRLTLSLAGLPAALLRPGVRGLQVVRQIAMGAPGLETPRDAFASNVAALALSPGVAAVVAAAEAPGTRVTVTTALTVGAAQRARLLIDRAGGGAAASFALDVAPRASDGTALAAVTPTPLASGSYIVRAEVDGVASTPAFAAGAYAPNLVVP
jgi:hypothetical protein